MIRSAPDLAAATAAVVTIATISPIRPSESRKISRASFSSDRSERRASGRALSRLSRSAEELLVVSPSRRREQFEAARHFVGRVDEVVHRDLSDQNRRYVELTADPSQERQHRLHVARSAAQRIVEFVENQDLGFQAVEQMIDLLGLAADIPAVSRRRA